MAGVDEQLWFTHPLYSRYWLHYHQSAAWLQRHRRYLNCYYDPHAIVSRRNVEEEPMESEADSDSDVEDEETSRPEGDAAHMLISDELRQYFAQTERHREERMKRQQMEVEQENCYVLADQDLYRVSWFSTRAPVEPPGERRAVEMQKLYGSSATKIHGMETVMQLAFDHKCDMKQLKYWPVIPLNL